MVLPRIKLHEFGSARVTQAQAVLMLTPRMPLYIPCVYNAFMYWPTAPWIEKLAHLLYELSRIVHRPTMFHLALRRQHS